MRFDASILIDKATASFELTHYNVMALDNRRILLDILFVSKTFYHEVDCPKLLKKFKLHVPVRCTRNKVRS